MRSLKNLSIRHKQTLIIMLTSSVALLLACAAFIAYDTVTFRRELSERVTILADAIGNNCAAAIDFNDPKTAGETLAALRADQNIISACVYSRDGLVFAVYHRDAASTFIPPGMKLASQEFIGDELHLFRVIKQGGALTGMIFVASDLDGLSARLRNYLNIVGLVFLTSLLAALLLSNQLQRLVADPILHLAQMTRLVAQGKNYSLRAEKQNPDEIGQLVDGFNEMLAEIQQRDAALQAARADLERRVEERTKELAQSLSLLNATLESTIDGILVVDGKHRVTSYNSRFIQMWRLPREKIIAGDDNEVLPLAMAQVKDGAAFLAKVQELYEHPEAQSQDVLELKDGRIFERDSQPQRLNGKCVGRVWSFRDITERKQAEAELSYERYLLRTLLDNSLDHIYFKDAQSRFIKSSRAQAIQFGVSSPDELVGKTDFDFFTDEHARPAFEDEQEIIRTGEPLIGKAEKEVLKNGRESWVLTTKIPFRNQDGKIIGTFGISKDITTIKETEAKLELVHRQLLETSRQAGMAEIATNVLHNVGNVLNSVNVSASLVVDSVKKSKAVNLAKVVFMLKEHANDLGTFLTSDPKGKQLPAYLNQLSEHLQADQKATVKELDLLLKNIEHIKEIVTMQQTYARVSGVKEIISIRELVEDGLRMNGGALARHRVRVIREFENVPAMNVEKHKILQILVNLIRNAKYACDESEREDKRLTVRVAGVDGLIKISVIDNGVGISPENLTRIFSHGFTTRKEGHGFGLHGGALAAREMGGHLSVQSNGIGQGATFTLELPLDANEPAGGGNDTPAKIS